MSTMNLLFLHGYTQSGPLFSAKTKAFQKAILKALPGAKFHFPTAPHALSPTDMPGEPVEGSTRPDEAYGWWRRTQNGDSPTPGIDATIDFLKSYVKEVGTIDGIVGFSQGAALAVLVAGLMERGEWEGHPAVKWVVEVAGFRVAGERWWPSKVKTPVLHVMGTLDVVVGEERGMAVVKQCEEGEERILRHPGGHYVPGGKMVVQSMVGWMVKWGKEEVEKEGAKKDEDENFDDFPF